MEWIRTVPIHPTASGLQGICTAQQALDGWLTGYVGYTLTETAGATAKVRFREGSASGQILETIEFGALQSVSDLYHKPILCKGDLYIELVSGTMPEGGIRFE